MDAKQLEEIAAAADRFETWLSLNSGETADWPVRIRADEDVAQTLCKLLCELHIVLRPYRAERKHGRIDVR